MRVSCEPEQRGYILRFIMNPEMVYQHPIWAVGQLLVGAAVFGAVLLELCARRLLPIELRERHNDAAAAIFSVTCVTHAVLLAFVAALAWQGLNRAKAADYSEAALIGDPGVLSQANTWTAAQTVPNESIAANELAGGAAVANIGTCLSHTVVAAPNVNVSCHAVVGNDVSNAFLGGNLIATPPSASVARIQGVTSSVATGTGDAVLSQSLDIKGSGPFPASMATVLSDVNPLRSYCYIGDGNSHPLSSVSSCNRVSTRGWTLTQWQSVLPRAAALTDEIDGDAINALIAASGSNPAVIMLTGNARINQSITSCAGPLYISGLGRGATITVATAGVTAFKHCQSASPQFGAAFQLRNLNIICANGVACGDVGDVTLSNSGEPGFLLDDVTTMALGTGQWANGFLTTGAGGTRILNSVISLGAVGTISGICLQFSSSAAFSVIFQMVNLHLYWCGQAINLISNAAGQGPEGIYMTGVNADQVINFFNYQTTGANYNPPGIVSEQTEVSFFKSIYSVSNASGTYETDWIIRDGWYIQLAPTTNSGAITPPTGLMDLGNAARVVIDGNTFQQSSGATFNYLINIGSSASDWTVEHNYVLNLLGRVNNGVVNINNGATSILEKENDFIYTGTRVNNAAWATVNVASEAYIWDQSGGACWLAGVGRRGLVGGRTIKCAGSISPSFIGGSATFTLPAAIFQGTTAPTVVTGNCRSSTSVYTGDTNGTPSFGSNQWTYTELCQSAPGTAAPNGSYSFQYTATGF